MSSAHENIPIGEQQIVHTFETCFWKVSVVLTGSVYSVRVEDAGYGKEYVSQEVSITDGVRASELCRLLREAGSLKHSLEAGDSCDQWLYLRDRFGLPLPNRN